MSNTTQTRVCDLGVSLGGDGVCLFECFHLFQALRRAYLKYAEHFVPAFNSLPARDVVWCSAGAWFGAA